MTKSAISGSRGDEIVAAPQDGAGADETVDASGLIAMAGGIDIHSHIAGAQREHRPPACCPNSIAPMRAAPATTPLSKVGWTTFETGRLYAEMGFTTVVEPAISPHHALHAHLELADTPIIDKALLTILGNDDFLLGLLRRAKAQARSAIMSPGRSQATRALGVKVINAGGAAAFKDNVRSLLASTMWCPSTASPRARSSRRCSRRCTSSASPHPLHVHCNNLGAARQRRHGARDHRRGRGAAAASRASAVLRLRQGGHARLLLGRAAARRGGQRGARTSPSTSGR